MSLDITGAGTFSTGIKTTNGSFTGDVTSPAGTFATGLKASTGSFSGAITTNAVGTFSGGIGHPTTLEFVIGATPEANMTSSKFEFSGEINGNTLTADNGATGSLTGNNGTIDFVSGIITTFTPN